MPVARPSLYKLYRSPMMPVPHHTPTSESIRMTCRFVWSPTPMDRATSGCQPLCSSSIHRRSHREGLGSLLACGCEHQRGTKCSNRCSTAQTTHHTDGQMREQMWVSIPGSVKGRTSLASKLGVPSSSSRLAPSATAVARRRACRRTYLVRRRALQTPPLACSLPSPRCSICSRTYCRLL